MKITECYALRLFLYVLPRTASATQATKNRFCHTSFHVPNQLDHCSHRGVAVDDLEPALRAPLPHRLPHAASREPSPRHTRAAGPSIR